ncbi:PST family polysaccharide transporter [Duganella sp. 3397]|uniref:O-antigen translocase n=1 Tax=Duganella sp. 3397 TaxID=2817732 RepID=UPI00285500AD|nr:O-antigen translocase [Duganella sp. 3397]MDR7051728.1 PST family polysaccharide transporter [Duganella sp. 3397]
MSLIKSTLLNGIAVAVKVGAAMILNKVLAVYVGPSGYAVIGQFQNALAVALSLGGGVMGPGITRGTAQHFDNRAQQHAIWRTAFKLTMSATLVASIMFIIAHQWLSGKLLERADMGTVFIGLGLAMPAIAINNLILAIINGKKDVVTYVSANVIGSICSLVVVGTLTYTWGLYGALLAIAISPAASLLATCALVSRRDWFKVRFLRGKVDRPAARELSGFGLMGLTSALMAPLTYMFIRNYLSETLGLNAAGYWQASWKISEIYLMMVTLTLSMYYLPRLAEIKARIELRKEVIKVYSVILPMVIIGAVIMYILRDFITEKLFSRDFEPMRDLFLWQLTGDVMKIGSWILAYVMQGRAMVRTFIVTEIIFSLSFYALTVVFVSIYGLQGVAIAYACNYLLYWISMAVLVKNEMEKMDATNV